MIDVIDGTGAGARAAHLQGSMKNAIIDNLSYDDARMRTDRSEITEWVWPYLTQSRDADGSLDPGHDCHEQRTILYLGTRHGSSLADARELNGSCRGSSTARSASAVRRARGQLLRRDGMVWTTEGRPDHEPACCRNHGATAGPGRRATAPPSAASR